MKKITMKKITMKKITMKRRVAKITVSESPAGGKGYSDGWWRWTQSISEVKASLTVATVSLPTLIDVLRRHNYWRKDGW